MEIVAPPFVVDYAAAYTISEVARMSWPEEVWEDWKHSQIEVFGADWPRVEIAREEFACVTGLLLMDIRHGNFTLR